MTISRRAVSLRLATSALLFVCVWLLAMATNSFAACSNDPDAAKKASDFIANPAGFLNGPSAEEITNDVQNFVPANPQALPVVLSMLKGLTANGPGMSDLQKAIGTGLGKAANICRTDTFSLQIQGNLAATGSPDANAQYAAITGNDPTRSVALSGATTGSSESVGDSTSQRDGSSSGSSAFQTFFANSESKDPTNYFMGSAGVSAAQRRPSSALFRTLASKS